MRLRTAVTLTVAWLAFVGWAIWHEWSRPGRDQAQATGAYLFAAIFGLCFVWPFVERGERS